MLPHRWFDRCILFVAQGFGLGLIPVAPGTWGTLWGLPLAWGLQFLPWTGHLAALCGFALLGVPLCTRACQLLGQDDPGSIVWDEIVACAAVLLFLPVTLLTCVLAFFWFRVFDISKPWPIQRVEHLPRGWGVMADDLVAAVYAHACVRVTMWALQQSGISGI